MKNVKIKWFNRYSNDDKPDKLKRWARIASVGDFKKVRSHGKYRIFDIAWIKQKSVKGKKFYYIQYLFPYGGGVYHCDSEKDAKLQVKKAFQHFQNCLK